MGLMNVCVARGMGAGRIILSEVSPLRLAQARQFDVDMLVNPAEQDLAKIVKDATGGLGADVAIVAAPAAAPQEMAAALVRKRGTVCLFASLPARRRDALDQQPPDPLRRTARGGHERLDAAARPQGGRADRREKDSGRETGDAHPAAGGHFRGLQADGKRRGVRVVLKP